MTSHFLTYFLLILFSVFCRGLSHAQEISLICEDPSGCAPHGVVVEAIGAQGTSLIAPQWTITTPTGTTLQSVTNPYVAIFNIPGNYDFALTVDGQTYFFDNYVTIYSRPVAQITTADGQGCLPFCATLTNASTAGSGAIISYSWDFGDGATSTEANPTHCYDQTGTFTPVLAIEDEFGCFASITAPQLITVTNNYPVSSFTTGPQSSCYLPTSIEFTANTASAGNTIHWMFNGESLAENNGTQSIQFSTPGVYNVCMAVENAIGCVDTSCQALTISDEPVAHFTLDNDTICANQTVNFTNASLPLPTSVEWDFNGNGSIDGTQNNDSYAYTTPGVYTVSMTAHYGAVCSVTVLDTVVVRYNPSVNFSGTILQSCAPPLVSTFTCSEAFNAAYGYNWTVNGVVVGNGHSLTYTFPDYGAYDIRLRRFTESGCERSRTKNDYVNIDAPDLSFDYEDLYCVGEGVVVSNIVLENNATILDYSWDFNGDGSEDALGANPSYVFDTAGDFFAVLTVTTADGCVSVDTTDSPITVLANVVPAFSANITESCAGQAFEFCTAYNADNTYTWDFHDGTAPQIMLEIDSCATHMYEDTGRFDVTLTIFNGACNSELTLEDYIHVVPPLALFEYDISCTDFAAAFHNTSIEGDSLIWDFGDSSPLVINETDPVHAYSGPGEYAVVLTAYKRGTECFDTKTLNVAVALPSTAINLTPPLGCAPLSVNLAANANNVLWDISIENGDHILAQFQDNLFSTGWNISYTHNNETVTSTSSSLDWPTLLFEEGGSYDIHVAVEDVFGCSAETTYPDAVIVWAGGDFSQFDALVVNDCDSGGVSVRVEAISPSAVSCTWQFSDGYTSSEHTVNYRFAPPFNYESGISCTLTAIDADGCTSSRSVAFNAVLPAVPGFTFDAGTPCRNEAVTFTNTSQAPQGTSFHWLFGDGSESAEFTTTSHAFVQNGSFTTCLAATNSAGCTTSYCSANTIEVYSPVASAEYSTELNTCLFAVTLTNNSSSGGDYTWWEFGDNQTGTGDTLLHTYPIGVYDIQLIIGMNSGCADTLVIEDILNYSSSVGPFSQVLDSANCAPFGVSFQAFNVADNLFQYFWDFNDGNGDPVGGTTTSHAYTEPGSYCPSIMMTDPNGCDVYINCTDTIVVENYTAEILIPAHICLGDAVVVEVQQADSFTWEHPLVEAGNDEHSVIVHADSSFQFEITARYSDCVYNQVIEISALPLPVVSLNLEDSLCSGTGNVALVGGYPQGGHYYFNNTETPLINTAEYTAEYAKYQYRYSGPNGCSNSASDSIYIIAPPLVEQLVNRSFCDGDSSLILISEPDSFYLVDGAMSTLFVPQYTGLSHSVSLHVYDAFGCHNSSAAVYNVHAIPVGIIDAPGVCAQEVLSANAIAGVSGSTIESAVWFVDDVNAGNGLNLQGPSFAEGGEHEISLTLLSSEGCVASIDTSFMVYDLPAAQFESSIACEKDTTALFDLSSFGNDSIVSWLWNYDGVYFNSHGDTTIQFPTPGTTNLTLEVTTHHGCSNQISRPLVVRYAPIVEASADDHCFGLPTLFESETSIPSGGITERFWSIENTPFIMQGEDVSYPFSEAGNYAFTFTAVSNFGCTTQSTDSVWVYALPQIHLPENEFAFCAMQPVGISAEVSVEAPSVIANCAWSVDGEIVSTENPAQFQATELGAYVVDVKATSNHGCETIASLDQPIVIYPNPTAGFTWTLDQLTESPSVQLIANASADVTSIGYNWGDGSSDEETSHTYSTDGTYEITQVVTNSFGCNAYYSETVEAFNGLQFYIPSAFSPDQNNHNEAFLPVVSGSFISYYVFRVFNRWGIEVFASTIPGEGWDGTYHGEPVQDGAYNWSVDMIVRGRKDLFVKKGSVLLMR